MTPHPPREACSRKARGRRPCGSVAFSCGAAFSIARISTAIRISLDEDPRGLFRSGDVAEGLVILIQNQPGVAGEGLDKPAAGTRDDAWFMAFSGFIKPDKPDGL